MGVQDKIALLNGNGADPVTPSHPGKRPTATLNWAAKRTNTSTAVNSADKKTDHTLTSIKPSNTTPSKTTNPTTTHPATTSTSSKCQQQSRTTVDMLVEELTAQYQEALDKNDSSKEIIAKLESDVERYACDSTKVRDYEIRVEYLAQKLEQVSEERDLLEQELSSYKDRHGSLATPVSPAFGPDVFGGGKSTAMIEAAPTAAAHQKTNTNQQQQQQQQQHNEVGHNNDTIEKKHQQQQQQLEDIYFDEILDAYEERRSVEDNGDMMMMQQQQEHNEQMMAQMLAEYDQGMKMAMEVYVADLEKQRLENKTLQSMVKKQDELIKKLETQCGDTHPSDDDENDHHPRFDNTNKEDQRSLQQQQLRASPSFRSSIDVLAEMARNDSMSGSLHHQQRDTGRNTPPPFAPPKTPLPPLPATGDHSNNTSINNDSLISYSRSSTSSTTCSSDEQQKHPLSTMTTALPPKHSSIDDHYLPDHTATFVGGGDTLDHGVDTSATTGSFWNGLKKKF